LPDPIVAPATDEADDLGSTLEANWDAQEQASTETPAAPAAETPAPTQEAPAAVEAARARDPATGKFTKAEQAAQAAAAAPAEFKIPEKWPADVRARLEAMHKVNPADAQFVLEQYEHFRRVAGQQAQYQDQRAQKLLTTQKQVEDLLAKGREQRALQGIDDTSYIRNLIAAGDVLDRDPVAGLKWLAQRYGVDLSNLNAPAETDPVKAEMQRVARENAEIKAMLLRGQEQQTQQQTEQQIGMASDWINRFASQVDGSGQPLYPHFDAVLPEIIVNVQYQMQSGQQVDVKAAYDRAIRMNDSVWLKEQTRRTATSRNEVDAKRKREIEEAKRAGFSVGGSGASSAETPPDDLGKLLERNYDRQVSS
jgi:hypothetical protein